MKKTVIEYLWKDKKRYFGLPLSFTPVSYTHLTLPTMAVV